jgi:hypothetical protein
METAEELFARIARAEWEAQTWLNLQRSTVTVEPRGRPPLDVSPEQVKKERNRRRAENLPSSHTVLAKHFKVSVPTIRRRLKES